MFWKRNKQSIDLLNSRLLKWTPNDELTARGLLDGGIAIFGRPGSGKTSASGRALGRAILGYPNSGGLILAAKPEDISMWRKIFADCGREDELIVFSPKGKRRFNFLAFLSEDGGDTREITHGIMTVGETLQSGDGRSQGEDGDFWRKQNERTIYNAVEIVRGGLGKVTAPDLQRFISTAAYTPEQIATEQWQAGFHNQCLKAAHDRPKDVVGNHDWELASDYWLGEFPRMADKTRSSILAGVMGIFHEMNTGICRELMSTTTNVTPHDTFRRKWVLVNMPPSEWGDSGRFVNAVWKYSMQRANLRRQAGPNSAINVIWVDEAWQFSNGFDPHYLAQCRSHRGCMVYLTQSKPGFYAAFKGESGRHQVDALLAAFTHKIFHALGDVETAEWAGSLVGRSLQTFVGGSTQPEGDMFDSLFGRSGSSGNFSEQYEQILQNNAFLTGLRTGGPENGFLADAILVRTGMPFSNGASFLYCTFNQRD